MNVFFWLNEHRNSTLGFRHDKEPEIFDYETNKKVDVDLTDVMPIFLILKYYSNFTFELRKDPLDIWGDAYSLTVLLKLPYSDKDKFLHYRRVFRIPQPHRQPIVIEDPSLMIGEIVNGAMTEFTNMIFGTRWLYPYKKVEKGVKEEL